ncbi:MAG TPA: 2-oxoacid:acceptor oxidoreductase family protein [Fimbriimonadaceae bacterium]|nr:2-oxoacid:acceptor oxidoreductase family protein [Fimbriimonadaceae bacterium]
MSKPIQIRLTGAGGQGLITAGVILAEAAVLDGRFVVQTQSYGPEARLGSSKAEVIISDDPIANPQVKTPDVLICLSEESVAKYGGECHSETLVVLDSTNIEKAKPPRGQVLRLPITQAAIDAGGKMVANVVALGIVNTLAQVVQSESLRAAILHRVPEKYRDLNIRALDAAEALVSEALAAAT